MFHLLCLVPHMANPSWCLLVIVMYRMPADFASDTHCAGSYFTGLNRAASFSYSAMGIWELFMTHSPLPRTLYTPQWMNMPNFESWNQRRAVRFARAGS